MSKEQDTTITTHSNDQRNVSPAVLSDKEVDFRNKEALPATEYAPKDSEAKGISFHAFKLTGLLTRNRKP
jgi:hypothetical protein